MTADATRTTTERKQIAGMRDKLIHEYDDVDLNEVWKTVRSDVPRVIKQLEILAPSKEENER